MLDRGPVRRVLEARQRESLSNFTHAVQAAHNARARFETGEGAESDGYVVENTVTGGRDEFEAFFALGRAGKTDERGLPNLLPIAVILDTYPDTIYRAGVPVPVQKLGIEMLAPIARMLGSKARYPELIGGEATEIV